MGLDTQTAAGSTSKLGKYELQRELAGSGVASTWLARTEEDPRGYVILRLHKHVTKKVEVAEAFLKDAKNGKLVSHTNLVPLVETGVGDGEVFVVSEHFEAEALSSLVTHAKTDGIPMPIALRIGLDMLEAVSAAHHAKPDAVAHGELSPFHVMVGKDGATRVAGLGWARALAKLGPHGIMKQERLAYAPPERVKVMSAATPSAPTGAIEPKGDVFAAAVILWELLSKQRLFASKMEAAVVQKVLSGPIAPLSSFPALAIPATIDVALQKALERDPGKRVDSVDEILAAIRALPEAEIAKPEEVSALVEKLAAKAAAAPQAPATTAAKAPSAPSAPSAPAARGPVVTALGMPAPKLDGLNGKAPVAAPKPQAAAAATVETKDGDEGATGTPSAKVPSASAPKIGAPKPIVRSKTLLGGVEPPKALSVAKPAGKPDALEDPSAKPADKPQDAPVAEAKKPGLPAPSKGLPPPARAGLPKVPPPPTLGTKPEALKPPPPMRAPAESLPADDFEVVPDSGPIKIEAKAEAKEAPKAEEPKVEAPKVEADKPEAPKAEEAKAAPKPEVKEPAKSEPVIEHVVATKSEAPTVVTKTPTSSPSHADSDGQESPVSRSNAKATALDRLKPGSTLGRYEILLRVAKGGMASVWAARLQGSRGFQKTVAIKTMLPDVSDDPDFETMFLDEARVAARIRHPNVVEIFDLGEQDDILYIVMEWVEGDTLSTLQKGAKSMGGIPQNIVLRLASQICAGLHAAHELRDDNGALVDLVHRDISPGNVLISTSGFAKIADFGVAKSRGRLYVTRAEGMVKGKTPYLSPEQLGGLPLDRRSDLFSLGVLLYVMITGLHPFRGETEFKTVENIALKDPIPPHELVPSVHPDFEKVIVKSLEKDRTKRYSTAAEMQRALDQVGQQLGSPVTDEDVADFVRKVIGEANAKRAAELRAAIAAADAGLAADRISIPPAVTSEAKPEPKAEPKPAAESFDIPVNLGAEGDASAVVAEAKPAPMRLETLPSVPLPTTTPAAKDDTDDAVIAAQAAQKKKRTIMGVGAAAVVALGVAAFAMSGSGDKPGKTPTTPEQTPTTTQAAPTPAPTPSPTPAATPMPEVTQPPPPDPAPAPEGTAAEPPKAEEPTAAVPTTKAGTWKAPAGSTTKAGTTKTGAAAATGTSKTTNKTTKKTTKYDPTGI